MTLCAGTCELKHGFCKITLSKPILEFRNNNELKETLLHEMIHGKKYFIFKINKIINCLLCYFFS